MRWLGKVALAMLFMLALVVGPVFTIWSLNLLFGLTIPVTLKTWLSALWLAAVVKAATSLSSTLGHQR